MTPLLTPLPLRPLPPPDADFSDHLPTQDELPCDDGIPMETPRHGFQMGLLIDALQGWLTARGKGYAGGNMFLYYSLEQIRHRDFMGPDFFVVLDAPLGERKSWVVWGEQGRIPDLVVELLSDSTAKYDKAGKMALYARKVRVPEYYWYDPFEANDFAGFILEGDQYRPLTPDIHERILSPALRLCLGRWEGTYMGVEAVWLRWFTPEGEILPTASETAQRETERVKQEATAAKQEATAAKQEATAAKQEVALATERAARLAEQLRRLGIDPDPL